MRNSAAKSNRKPRKHSEETRAKIAFARKNQRPPNKTDGDEIAHESVFESLRFKRFKQRVEDVIRKSKDGLTIRQIKHKLGASLIDNWLADALSLLERETITARAKTAEITVYRYSVNEAKETQTMAFNSGIEPGKGLPYLQL